MKIKRLRLIVINNWQPLLLYLVTIAFVLLLLGFKLGTLVPGLSQTEVNAKTQALTIKGIAHHPDNAPFKVLEHFAIKIKPVMARNLRIVSAAFGLMTVLLFYYVAQAWNNRLQAILGTLLFTASAWLLHTTRLATPSILLTFGLVAILAFGVLLNTSIKTNLVVISGGLLALLSLYIPGLFWLVLLGAIWKRNELIDHIKQANKLIILLTVIGFLLGTAPIIWAATKQLSILETIAGFSIIHTLTLRDVVLNIARIPSQIFWRGPNNPITWLSRIPLIDIFTSAMVVVGVYGYFYHWQLDRVKVLFGLFFGSVLLIAINGSSYMVLLLPIIYLLATAGISLLLEDWLTVFPHNPLARTLGTCLISVAVLFTIFYHVRQYFIAWPNAPETKKVFQLPSQ